MLREASIPFYKYIQEMNTRKEKELHKLKDSADLRTNGYKLAKNKFRLQIRSFLTNSGVRLWNSPLVVLVVVCRVEPYCF